jgi:hypothetical protein
MWDDSLDESESVPICFIGLLPTSYNGIPVDKSLVKRGITGGMNSAYIGFPAGRATMLLDVAWASVNSSYQSNNNTFTYVFEAGESYYLIYASKGDQLGVNVYKTTIRAARWPPDDSLEAFVPFTQNRERTILQ